jgi:hypothetical protein
MPLSRWGRCCGSAVEVGGGGRGAECEGKVEQEFEGNVEQVGQVLWLSCGGMDWWVGGGGGGECEGNVKEERACNADTSGGGIHAQICVVWRLAQHQLSKDVPRPAPSHRNEECILYSP